MPLAKLSFPWWSPRKSSPANEGQARIGQSWCAVSPSEDLNASQAESLGSCEVIETGLGMISSLRFSSDGKHLLVGGKCGKVQRWSVGQIGFASQMDDLIHSEGGINTAAFSKDCNWIILAQGRMFAVWSAITHERVSESAEAHEQEIITLDISSDASKIASGSRDGAVIVWCLETGQRLAGPFNQERPVLSLRFSPSGERLASTGWHCAIHVWDMCGEDHQAVTRLAYPVSSLSWSSHGHQLFGGCSQGYIFGFNIFKSTLCHSMLKRSGQPHADSITALEPSNNGKFIISASSSESVIKIWDTRTWSEIGSLHHTCRVLNAEISPDDSHLVIGMRDGKAMTWHLREVLSTSYFSHELTAYLTLPSDKYPILTHVHNAVYVAWRESDLAKAEKMLSSEIECGSNLPYALANRALVLTRLRQWDGALDDANRSHKIESSTVALLARGIALFGCKMYDTAIQTFDIAFENCHQEEKDFVIVIKAITSFDFGFHDEAIHLVSDLVSRSLGAKHPLHFVMAKMYALLGSKAINDLDHSRAVVLFEQARDICPPDYCEELDTVSFISGWKFDGLRLEIYRQSCEAYYAVKHTEEALHTLRDIENIFPNKIRTTGGFREWLPDFKFRCIAILESQGDREMDGKNYGAAIAQYSAALDINLASSVPSTLLVKRSDARMGACLWEDALKDANEAVRLDPSSPWGHERKHAALHKLECYVDAIEAMRTMISIIDKSFDLEIQSLGNRYVNPSDTEKAILKAFAHSVHHSPFRLIDTVSGRVCDAEQRKKIFKEDPVFQELVSSMTTRLHQERISAVTQQFFQYVMLSHRWEEKELELADVLDKSIYDLDSSVSATKLKRFCTLARDSKYRWAWSDTCCINKDKDVEFEKSINSMFHWYRGSAATFVCLTGVPSLLTPGGLKGSVWMRRGWTLQELLAPPVIRFFYEDWTPYLNDLSLNHKDSVIIMQELEDATRVTAHDLLAFHPGPEDARVKLRLASTRETTIPVDMAYGLFGVFGTTMPVIHGESQQHALGRLFQEIVTRSGDVACLTWVGGRSSEFNSTFPDHIRVYENASHTVPYIGEKAIETQVADLQRTWSDEEKMQAMAFCDRLSRLPPARCIHQRIHLSCIVFSLTSLEKIRWANGLRMYRATARELKDTNIYTKEKLLEQGSEDFILACPWIYELLDSTPRFHHVHHDHSVGDVDLPSDSDSEPDPERDSLVHRMTPRSGHATISSMSPSGDLPPGLSQVPDATLKASRLVIRTKQELGALLLGAHGHEQYKRTATDQDIIIRVREGVLLGDLDLRTLEIV